MRTMRIYQELELDLRKMIYEMGMKRYLIMQALLITFILTFLSIFKINDFALMILSSFTGGMADIWFQFAFFKLFIVKGRVPGRKTLKWQ